MEKNQTSFISYFIPAYNCEGTIEDSVNSIINGNLQKGDEIVIVDDASTDNTPNILQKLSDKYEFINVIRHRINLGGACARNTAILNSKNELLFCLDSDNLLVPQSVPRLKNFLITSGSDIAVFKEQHYFQNSPEQVTHKWIYSKEQYTLEDCLSDGIFPGASGNYMFTKDSWIRAKGYPVYAGALDTWGLGFLQLASGAKMRTMPDSHYLHRHGHESYWVRDRKEGKLSLKALYVVLPYLDLIEPKDINYIMSRKGRLNWFRKIKKRPIRIKTESLIKGFWKKLFKK